MPFLTCFLLIVLKLSCALSCLCFPMVSLQVIVAVLIISLLSDLESEKIFNVIISVHPVF